MQGDSFSNLLKSRQLVAREAAKYVENHAQNHQSTVYSDLARIFQLLLPSSSAHEKKWMQRIFETVVSLKKAMTEENVMYHCYWVERGEKFDWESMETRLD